MKGIHVQLLCVGKMKEKFYIDAAAEYVKRLGAYCRLQVVELPEERLPANPSRAQIDAALEKEGAAIRARLAPGAALVALCVEGGGEVQRGALPPAGGLERRGAPAPWPL